MESVEWRLIESRLPPGARRAALALVAVYLSSAALLAAVLPRAPLGVLARLDMPWILSWTTAQAAASAGLAVLLGTPVGVAAGYYGVPVARAYRVLGLPVFMAPTVAVVLGFRWLAGLPLVPDWLAEAPAGIILVHAYFNIPLAAVLAYSSVAGVAAELVDYIEGVGIRGWRLWARVLAPAAAPGALAAWTLAFIYAFTGLAAPLMVEGAAYRYYTLEAWIYTVYWGFPAWRLAAAALALLQAAVLLAASALLLRALQAAPRIEAGEAYRRPRGGAAARILSAYSLVLLAALYAPLAGVAAASVVDPYTGEAGLGAYQRLLQGPLPVPPGASFPRALANSVLYATVTAALATILGSSLAAGGTARRLAGLAPLAVSPVVAGVGLHLNLYPPLAAALGHTAAIAVLVVLAHTVMALPLASRSLEVALRRVPSEALAFLASIGLHGWSLQAHLLRAAAPGLAAAAALSAASSLGEFGAVLVVTDPSTWSLGVLVYNLYSAGRMLHVASAAATILLSLTLALTALVASRVREWF